ncbi:MAG: EF-P lysine aminoacylase EpmA [Planctomycetaceae bacterium]
MNDDWRPLCSVETLRIRAAMLRGMRQFFHDGGYLEVETPLLSADIVVDAHLEPFEIQAAPARLFLQTSPEAGMKRLLAAGCGSIFQITRSFRRDEFGPRHNPEFTIVEWYGIGTSASDQMQFTADLIQAAIDEAALDSDAAARLTKPFSVRTYEDAFRHVVPGSVLDASVEDLRQRIAVAGLLPNVSCLPDDRDDLLNLLLAEYVEPKLGSDSPLFLTDYPASQAALAELSDTDHRVAKRFELYVGGIELCNGYQELTDVAELRKRDETQNASRTCHGVSPLPGAARLMNAMRYGLPNCSGVALGFDRLVMAATGAASIRDVIPFPIDVA